MGEELKSIKTSGSYEELVQSIVEIHENLSAIVPMHPSKESQVEKVGYQLRMLSMVLTNLFRKLEKITGD